jgi:hypothetical protein
LARVAQFLAVTTGDGMFPKEDIVERLKDTPPPDFTKPDEPHDILADLPLPIYITTNYDDFMAQALKSRNKNPRQELCQWNDDVKKLLKGKPSVFNKSSDLPDIDAKNPVVFHLHGHLDIAESLVLTEDDYLDFLVSISRNDELIPPRIQESMTGTTLLFLGYKLADWDFRVLFRSMVNYLKKSTSRSHVSVQLITVGDVNSPEEVEKAQKYLDRYFDRHEIHMYWGSCCDFAAELKTRWEASGYGQ